MKKYTLWMLIICVIPILLLFVLPTLGFGEIINDLILVTALFVIFMVMPENIDEIDETDTVYSKNHKKKINIFRIDPRKLGISIGFTFFLLYIGCMILMYYLGHDGTVTYFNNMLHGIDISTIVKMNVTLAEAFAGIIEIFILGTFIGLCIGGFYNILLRGR
jgi:hypothetical protein